MKDGVIVDVEVLVGVFVEVSVGVELGEINPTTSPL